MANQNIMWATEWVHIISSRLELGVLPVIYFDVVNYHIRIDGNAHRGRIPVLSPLVLRATEKLKCTDIGAGSVVQAAT